MSVVFGEPEHHRAECELPNLGSCIRQYTVRRLLEYQHRGSQNECQHRFEGLECSLLSCTRTWSFHELTSGARILKVEMCVYRERSNTSLPKDLNVRTCESIATGSIQAPRAVLELPIAIYLVYGNDATNPGHSTQKQPGIQRQQRLRNAIMLSMVSKVSA